MTPVVFIHWLENDYLWMAVNQAAKYNKVEVMLNPRIAKYSMEVDRWFVLRDWMIRTNTSRCLYVDSDVLLYKNVDDDFRDCDLAFSKSHSGHTMFVNNIKALADFCYYIELNIKKDPAPLINKTRTFLPGHVFPDTMGDMVLLNNFMLDDTRYFFRDTAKIYNNSVYDHNINTDGIPQCRAEGIPYRVLPDGNAIRMNSLHFQGAVAKVRMKGFLQ